MATSLEIFNTVVGIFGVALSVGGIWQSYEAKKAAERATKAAQDANATAKLAVQAAFDSLSMFNAERFVERLSALKGLHMMNASSDYLQYIYDELAKEISRFRPLFADYPDAQKAVLSLLTNLRSMEGAIMDAVNNEAFQPKKKLNLSISKDVDVLIHRLTEMKGHKSLEALK